MTRGLLNRRPLPPWVLSGDTIRPDPRKKFWGIVAGQRLVEGASGKKFKNDARYPLARKERKGSMGTASDPSGAKQSRLVVVTNPFHRGESPVLRARTLSVDANGHPLLRVS